MFNRQLKLTLEKPTKENNANESVSSSTSVDLPILVRETVEAVGTKIIFGITVYVAVDTLRQVIVKGTVGR